jgi:glyoxylase-like metal-dependent hydrolase (beta-lactamase superfamily II)
MPLERDINRNETLAALDARSYCFRIEAQGSRWEPLQGMRAGGPPLRPSDFTVAAVHDLARDRMRLSWQRTFLEPLTATVEFDEIVVGNEGYITGPDIALHPQAARPMTSDRLAAVRRQQYLLNPQLLVGDALRRQRDTGQQVIRSCGRERVNGVSCEVFEIDDFPRPVRLLVDPVTHHVTRLVTQENDFPCGDVEIAVTFSDWRHHHGMDFPYEVELSWDGVVMHRETRQRIDINPPIDANAFLLPGTLAFDPAAAARGRMHAQWLHRALAMGAPIILDAGPVEPVAITPAVVTMGGGIHHSLAIALDSGVVVVDSPQHEARSLAVIKAIHARWPDKPITHLILTHHHHDHSGGIRAYAAIGAALVVAQGDRDFIARCLTRPHTISPDTLAAAAPRPAIHAVGDECLSLGDGAVTIHRISSPHSSEDLVVYIASVKMLFNADLFNPGLVAHGFAPPPHWLTYSRDFRKQIEALGLDIQYLLGAHGVPEGGPYQELIDFTEQTGG